MAGNDEAVTPPPAPAYRRINDLVLLSGQVGVDALWRVVGPDFEDEARQVFRNIATTLAEVDCTLADAVFVRTYLSDFAYFAAFNDVWRAVFGDSPPARTTVQAGLHPPFRIECEVVAAVPPGAAGSPGR
ncbi:RidA family protein [Tsukamurella asaccharolytica]|uniref:RidA family protein n=1 Tax=Tsukamurella asaccharolytica TaxID=2592067 RepID=A0A5C5RDD2_9ACTN|nr:RidA family protein [Tsukamurella asaccharolytica]TWS20876.1 RidA family protein [Tsukamurella asaccharolytica]